MLEPVRVQACVSHALLVQVVEEQGLLVPGLQRPLVEPESWH